MKLTNRFIALEKRILSKKMYLCLLLLIIAITAIYQFLPARNTSADIKVAMYSEDTSGHYEELVEQLEDLNSIYSFYTVDSEEELTKDVGSGYAQCGYAIPEGFFQSYVEGSAWENPMKLYITPSSTFYSVINETVFSSILSVCAQDLLLYSVSTPSFNRELAEGLEYYRNSQDVFTIADTTSGEFTFENMVYHIKLPIMEIVSVLILFSALLGLLLHLHDRERKIYVALPDRELSQVKAISIFTALVPITIIGMLSMAISYEKLLYPIFVLIVSAICYLLVILLSLIIKKSSHLEKLLPLIMLAALIGVFIKTII